MRNGQGNIAFLLSFPLSFHFLVSFFGFSFPASLPFLSFACMASMSYSCSIFFTHSCTHYFPSPRYTHRRDFDFDDTLKAMVTMFEVLTLEGWLDVRDMLVRDPVSPGIPSTQEAWVS